MIGPTPESVADPGAGRMARWAHGAVLGAICVLVIGMYAWSAKSGWLELWSLNAENTYYNLLVQGFRAGQLNLEREVPPGLAQLANPYDPKANSPYMSAQYPLIDLSYYQGKLYLYFGVTPALVLFWPYYELTGHYLFHKDAVLIFCIVGFLANVGLLWAVWRRYFAEVGVGVVAAGTLALGLAPCTLMVLARSDVHEVVISCGYALTMLCLLAIWKALHATGGGRGWWVAGASLAYGLAVGARPSLLFGAVILLVPVVVVWRERPQLGQPRGIWILLLAAVGPVALIGLGLMLYNDMRFDDPFEFGWRHQLSWEGPNTGQGFNLRYLWYNFRIYFLEPAQWSIHFPFVHNIRPPALPVGHGLFEHPFGVLTNVPLVWLALAVPSVWRGGLNEPRSALRCFGITSVLLFGICALTLCLFVGATLRYELEFLPTLMLLAVLGTLGLERILAGRPVWRRTARWGWGLLLAFSVMFNLFAVFDRYIETYILRGTLFLKKGQVEEAMVQYRKMLKAQPDNWQAANGLGEALLQQGKVQEAVGYLEKTLLFNPDYGDAHNTLGVALVGQGKVSEAIGHYERALQLKPEDADAHYNLGNALIRQGRVPEAIAHYEQALQLRPQYPKARNNLGNALVQQGRVLEAIGHYERALLLNPNYADAGRNLASALNTLAWILATETNGAIRNVEEAVRYAERACELTTNSVAVYLDTLGMAYSESGRFNEATRASERGAALARAAGNKELAALIESRLKHYREGRPYDAIPKGTGP